MTITEAIWLEAIIWCDGCEKDLARVRAREDYRKDFNGTIGTVIYGHGHRYGHDHWGTCRSVFEGTQADYLAAGQGAEGREGGG